jgi:hypothetical protein
MLYRFNLSIDNSLWLKKSVEDADNDDADSA